LHLRQPFRQRQHRTHELVQPRERQIDLGLHASGLQDTESTSQLHRIAQQRRLAHPRLTVEHQDATTTRTSRNQQTLDQSTLTTAADHPQRLRAAQKADQRPDH
jgi:uncharacterized membrane protein